MDTVTKMVLFCVDQNLHKKTWKIQEIAEISLNLWIPLDSPGVILRAVLWILRLVVAIDALLTGHNVRFPSIHGNISHGRRAAVLLWKTHV